MNAGDLVTFTRKEMRAGAAPVMTRYVGAVDSLHTGIGSDGDTLVLIKVLRCFCWVFGYPDLGRYLPVDRSGYVAALSEVSPLFTGNEGDTHGSR